MKSRASPFDNLLIHFLSFIIFSDNFVFSLVFPGSVL